MPDPIPAAHLIHPSYKQFMGLGSLAPTTCDACQAPLQLLSIGLATCWPKRVKTGQDATLATCWVLHFSTTTL